MTNFQKQEFSKYYGVPVSFFDELSESDLETFINNISERHIILKRTPNHNRVYDEKFSEPNPRSNIE